MTYRLFSPCFLLCKIGMIILIWKGGCKTIQGKPCKAPGRKALLHVSSPFLFFGTDLGLRKGCASFDRGVPSGNVKSQKNAVVNGCTFCFCSFSTIRIVFGKKMSSSSSSRCLRLGSFSWFCWKFRLTFEGCDRWLSSPLRITAPQPFVHSSANGFGSYSRILYWQLPLGVDM